MLLLLLLTRPRSDRCRQVCRAGADAAMCHRHCACGAECPRLEAVPADGRSHLHAQCICSAHMQCCTCSAHAVHTCSATHAVHMQCTHAVPRMQCTCSAAHAVRMRPMHVHAHNLCMCMSNCVAGASAARSPPRAPTPPTSQPRACARRSPPPASASTSGKAGAPACPCATTAT